ncbi:hypothetical protein RsS62_05670 [Rhizobium dioscoreae]|nr:hypothetical protein RsS62_05670 [Rhizobium dioscoreae]
MACFRNDEIPFGVVPLPFRHIVEEDKDVGAIVIRVHKAARIDEERTPADSWKIMRDFVPNDSGCFWDDRGDQLSELGNIPLTVAEIKETLSQNIVPLDLERFQESVVCGRDAQVLIKNDNRLRHRIDHSLRLDMSGSQKAV